MGETKQVKVDNWGIYFLQRLKHFFNRTDYCDLTLHFQDNAQLKVHRLVLSACTEYFELLERTCEMYEDCLVMPDDLQADVVVPIVNFMYTGQLEFKLELLDKLYQTSQIMNMPVLTKLLDAQRSQITEKHTVNKYNHVKDYTKTSLSTNQTQKEVSPLFSITNSGASNKRSYSKAFEKKNNVDKKLSPYIKKPEKSNQVVNNSRTISSPSPQEHMLYSRRSDHSRPTRYELPEELDVDNVFEDSFCSLSYESKPLMVHPETKQFSSRRRNVFCDSTGGKKYLGASATLDIVECRKISKDDNIFLQSDDIDMDDDFNIYGQNISESKHVKNERFEDSNQLFDKILGNKNGPKVTIETKDTKADSLDHAKIISEVLKKYPHLVKSNKNIKLKIVNTPKKTKKQQVQIKEEKIMEPNDDEPDFTYETDILDSKEAAKLIAKGAENTKGPWICLICGTPGKALNFTSYYKFRRHLVEVHHEKPIPTLCEYCGFKSPKRNYFLHHMYTKHGVKPPPPYRFPKCNMCNYIALTDAFLVRHKISHSELKTFRCNICPSTFSNSHQLLQHIQQTGHKYSADKKTNLQCIYCFKMFLREVNLYAHLKSQHKHESKADCIIDDSEEEIVEEEKLNEKIVNQSPKKGVIKYEPKSELEIEYEDGSRFQYQQRQESNTHITNKPQIANLKYKQKILNPGYNTPTTSNIQQTKHMRKNSVQNELLNHNIDAIIPEGEEIVVIGDNEYIMKDNQLIPRKINCTGEELILPHILPEQNDHTSEPPASIEYTNNIYNINFDESVQLTKTPKKISENINHPIQIVVSNDEEYKALMSSNHSIIFDDGMSNKTLTVLAAPHPNTTIDLNVAQSNEMMIIQDNYPMTISENVPVDNSNIVVVYSHPVNDNKQYQLVTPQGLGTQYVPPSTVITQNYGPIVSSTPVVSAQIIDADSNQNWGNLHQSITNHEIEISAETIQETAHLEQIQETQTETNNYLAQLPEVQIPSITSEVTCQTNPTDDTQTNETHEPTEGNTNIEQVVEDSNPISILEVNNQLELMSEKIIHISTEQHQIEDNDVAGHEVLQECTVSMEPILDKISDTFTKSTTDNEVDIQIENTELAADEIDVEKTMVEKTQEDSNVVITPINNENMPTKITTAEIRNLTSEWSEDEDESVARIENKSNLNQPQDPKSSVEVEESIENIQLEMEKHTKKTNITEESQVQEILTSLEERNILPAQNNQIENETEKSVELVVPQKKISSLLNDWEENGSEDVRSSLNDKNILTQDKEETVHTMDSEQTSEDINPSKNNNIKSLVSDWDDEDEDKE